MCSTWKIFITLVFGACVFRVWCNEKKNRMNRKTLLKSTLPFRFFLVALSVADIAKVCIRWDSVWSSINRKRHLIHFVLDFVSGVCKVSISIVDNRWWCACFSALRDFWFAVIYRELTIKSYSMSPVYIPLLTLIHFIETICISCRGRFAWGHFDNYSQPNGFIIHYSIAFINLKRKKNEFELLFRLNWIRYCFSLTLFCFLLEQRDQKNENVL